VQLPVPGPGQVVGIESLPREAGPVVRWSEVRCLPGDTCAGSRQLRRDSRLRGPRDHTGLCAATRPRPAASSRCDVSRSLPKSWLRVSVIKSDRTDRQPASLTIGNGGSGASKMVSLVRWGLV
jgi:hypothetical protein